MGYRRLYATAGLDEFLRVGAGRRPSVSDAFWIALFATVPSLASLAGVIYSIRVSQGNRRAVNDVAVTVDRVQQQTNGMLKHIADAAEAKGILVGVKQEQDNPTK